MRNFWLFLAALMLPVFVLADEPAKKPQSKEPAKEAAKEPAKEAPKPPAYTVPDLRELIAAPRSELAEVTRRYETDRATLLRTYPVPASPMRYARLARFYQSWRTALDRFDQSKLSLMARIEYSLLRVAVEHEWQQLNRHVSEEAAIMPLLPFAETIVDLEESRRRMEPVDPVKAAAEFLSLVHQCDK